MYEVVGLGQCSLDIIGKLDQYPALDQKAELDSLLIQGGGPVATALVTLSRLGVSTAFSGAVGDDHFGQQIRQGLIDERVDCSCLKVQKQSSSQVAFIAVDEDGHRNIFWHRGEAAPQLPKELSAILNKGVRVLHLDGLHLEPAIQAAQVARQCHVVTVLDAGTLRPGMDDLLPLIDHLVVSEKFAYQISESMEPQRSLSQLAEFGAQTVTITCGKNGSYSLEANDEMFFQPAFEVGAVDTTGCGDVFHGGYIFGLLKEWPLRKTVRFAAACAALKARALGGRTAIPSLKEVEAFLAARKEA